MTRIARLGLVLASATALAVVVAPLAAAEDPDGLITWSVKPADATGKDGRAWMELDVDPGETVIEHLALTNFSDAAVTFSMSAADGYLTRTGRFTMLPAGEPSKAAGTWIDVPKTLTVDAGATTVVPFTISVPDNAIPGDNAAGVAASVFSAGNTADGTQVGLESRVGFRVMLRVAGELSPAHSVEGLTGTYDLSWNPFRAGSVKVGYDLVNQGNTRLAVSGHPEASGRSAGEPSQPEAEQELLPGDVRHQEQTITGVWPIGLVRVVVAADATVVPGDAAVDSAQSEIWIWAIPLPQLILLMGAGLIVTGLVWRRRRSRANLEKLLADVRRETEQAVRTELGDTEEQQ